MSAATQYFDPASGTKRPVTPLKSAVQAAEVSPPAIAAAAAAPTKPAPIRPPEAMCRLRHKSLGTIPFEDAAAVLERELQEHLKTIGAAMPVTAASIVEMIGKRDDLDSKIASAIAGGADLIGRLRGAFLFRADLRQQAAETTIILAESEKTLNDPKSLALPDDVLVRLTQNTRLLPGVVADLKGRIAECTDLIQRLANDAGITPAEFVAFLLRDQPEQHVLTHHRRGFLN